MGGQSTRTITPSLSPTQGRETLGWEIVHFSCSSNASGRFPHYWELTSSHVFQRASWLKWNFCGVLWVVAAVAAEISTPHGVDHWLTWRLPNHNNTESSPGHYEWSHLSILLLGSQKVVNLTLPKFLGYILWDHVPGKHISSLILGLLVYGEYSSCVNCGVFGM